MKEMLFNSFELIGLGGTSEENTLTHTHRGREREREILTDLGLVLYLGLS